MAVHLNMCYRAVAEELAHDNLCFTRLVATVL